MFPSYLIKTKFKIDERSNAKCLQNNVNWTIPQKSIEKVSPF